MNAKFFNYAVVALATVTISTSAAGKQFLSFRADLTSKSGTINRTVTVFNTKNNPNLVEQVAAMLAAGSATLGVVFDKIGKGEVARVIGYPPATETAKAAPAQPFAVPVAANDPGTKPKRNRRKAVNAVPAADLDVDGAVPF